MSTITKPQSETVVPEQRRASVACPEWCNPGLHMPNGLPTDATLTAGDVVHLSDLRVWEGDPNNDTPRYSLQFYRGDESYRGEIVVGQTGFSVIVSGGYDVEVDDEGRTELYGNLTANDARNFACWLSDQAREIDPHHNNGAPPRVPHQGCSCGIEDD